MKYPLLGVYAEDDGDGRCEQADNVRRNRDRPKAVWRIDKLRMQSIWRCQNRRLCQNRIVRSLHREYGGRPSRLTAIE